MTGPLVTSVRDAARSSGLPRDLLYEAIRDGRLKVLRRGRRILLPTAELEGFVEREASNGGEPAT